MTIRDHRYIKTDEENFIRDRKTTAVLNTDIEALAAYKKERERRVRVESVVEEVESIKNDLSQIKELLSTLVNRS